jgi:tetratricopeptide (TPR) repeat protein
MKNLIVKIYFLAVIGFLGMTLAYAETAEEYYARTGNAVVSQPGGGFVKAYVPKQDNAKREELVASVLIKQYESNPQAAEYNRQGMVVAKSGDYYKAIQYFDRAIEIQPNFPQAYHNRGLAYSALSNHNQAIAEYGRSIELDSGNPVVYYDRAVSYSALKDYPQVIADCTTAIKMGYYFGAAYGLRGAAYNNLRNYEKALADFLQAHARGENVSQDLIKEVREKMKAEKASIKAKAKAEKSEEEKKKEAEEKN